MLRDGAFAPFSPLVGENGEARFSPEAEIVGVAKRGVVTWTSHYPPLSFANVSLPRAATFAVLPHKEGEGRAQSASGFEP